MGATFLAFVCIHLSLTCVAVSASEKRSLVSVVDLFSNIKGSTGSQYDVKDDQGQQMASLHVCQSEQSQLMLSSEIGISPYKYYGVYHSLVDGEFQVRLATSNDLRSWTYIRTLISNADMPYILYQGIPGAKWILLAHEQWMNPGSNSPSRLGFKLYYSETELIRGVHFNSYLAPLTVGEESTLEGTPNIYAASLVFREGYYMVDASIGFHYNDPAGVDQMAEANLTSFGPTVVIPQYSSLPATGYNNRFIEAGAEGNIGQRMEGTVNGMRVVLQEANFGPMPPTVWQNWRVWLYFPQNDEGVFPTGAGRVEQLVPQTHKGSCAFGNPAFAVVDCPTTGHTSLHSSTKCLFVSYFIFSEGAAPQEAAACTFYNELP